MYWTIGVGVIAFVVAALNAQIAKTSFSCNGRTSGYYADMETGCQVYHMCDGLGRQFSYTCPNATLFQQRMLICDHWYMVNCSKSEGDYDAANLRIGQRETPFVDDSETNPYHRTPRPDLLSHSSENEYNIIYRAGRARLGNNNRNLVGVESDSELHSNYSTEQPVYFLPSHWSTEYSQYSSTVKPSTDGNTKDKVDVFNNKKNVVNNTKIKGKPVIPTITATEAGPVNYRSSFKATTPVFPKTVEAATEAPDSTGLLPPLPYRVLNDDNGNDFTKFQPVVLRATATTESIPVNYNSNFRATTPVFPQTVEATTEAPDEAGLLPPLPYRPLGQGQFNGNQPVNPVNTATAKVPVNTATDKVPVNYNSNFKATTPVFPLTVDVATEAPDSVGLLPPLTVKTVSNNSASNDNTFQEVVPTVNFRSGFKATTPVYPLSVEPTSPEPGDLGVLPPLNPKDIISDKTSNENNKEATIVEVPSLSLDFEPPAIDVNFKPRNETYEVQQPSKFYQPPKFEPDYTELTDQDQDGPNKKGGFKSLNSREWESLRRKFLIPDYDFPLDSASRPSYDSVLSSFQPEGVFPGKK